MRVLRVWRLVVGWWLVVGCEARILGFMVDLRALVAGLDMFGVQQARSTRPEDVSGCEEKG